MNEQEKGQFNDQTQMKDLLLSEKNQTGLYNICLCESATPEVIRCLTELLRDSHDMQQHLFSEMNSRGWYPVCKAEDTKLNKAKNQFATKITR